MKIVIFGLAITSSWGNGHATLWRGLWRALANRGHRLVFFEKDVPYYAAHRDLTSLEGGDIILYPEWEAILPRARPELSDADVAMVTSYCPDGAAASQFVLESNAPAKCFYDLDTPVTLDLLRSGKQVSYLPEDGLRGFDLVLSYTGGQALNALRTELGAQRAVPLYGSVDPEVHHAVRAVPHYTSDLSYLGTYAEDRQEMLVRLLVEPARRLPGGRFLIGGAQYPDTFPWSSNIFFVRHLPPAEHPAFYSSSRATLNVTRRAMAEMGYCPSGRLFEAAACGAPIISDSWEGLSDFFQPGVEIAIATGTEEALAILNSGDELVALGRRARERTLDEHTASRRAIELELILESSPSEDIHDEDQIFAVDRAN
jgi:spore maturation protein CgeB